MWDVRLKLSVKASVMIFKRGPNHILHILQHGSVIKLNVILAQLNILSMICFLFTFYCIPAFLETLFALLVTFN